MENATENNFYVLFKGDPGTRKSTQALTYPKPQYWFSFDGKMKAMRLPMIKFGINPKDIHYDDYNDWSLARTKLESLQINCPYKTIVIDSVTSMADKMLRQVIKAKTGGVRKSGQAAGKMIGGIAVNELEDFNAEAAGITEMIDLTKDIYSYHKTNIILIAHVIGSETKDINGIATISRVLVTAAKKNGAKIPAYCDETYQFGVEPDVDISKGGNYHVITSHLGYDFARTSLPLPPKIIIGNDNLYEKYITPAIEKLNKGEV